MVKAAILGYGTVGSGVAEVLSCNQELIAKRAGNPIEVKYILDLRNFPGDPNETKVVHDIEVILQDPEISIVCETMGGNEPAYTFSKRALEAGKSVCTSNKELVANHGAGESLQLLFRSERRRRYSDHSSDQHLPDGGADCGSFRYFKWNDELYFNKDGTGGHVV